MGEEIDDVRTNETRAARHERTSRVGCAWRHSRVFRGRIAPRRFDSREVDGRRLQVSHNHERSADDDGELNARCFHRIRSGYVPLTVTAIRFAKFSAAEISATLTLSIPVFPAVDPALKVRRRSSDWPP